MKKYHPVFKHLIKGWKVLIMGSMMALSLGLAACEKEGPAEKAGEKVDEAVEKMGDQLEKAGDKVEEATDKMNK